MEKEIEKNMLILEVTLYYDNGKLIFEGEYLYNFKLKGKEYVNEKLEYEGEYLYIKKWKWKC